MSKLEKYKTYKDSGIHTSIQLPEHWNIKRFKHLFSFGKGLNITKENLEDTGIKCVNYGEIHSKYGFEVNPDIHDLKCVNESYLKKDSKSLLNIGDFIFADTSEDVEGSGNFTHLSGDKKIFAGYHTMICRPRKTLDSRYYAYLFDSKSFRSQLHKKVKGVKVYSITQNILKDTYVWIPEEKEQAKITSYLDEKTAQIDNAISQKEKLIELLKERRQITINEAVTKGLNKDVEFKDSGVEWIGEIPKHWETLPLKACTKLKSIKNVPDLELLSVYLDLGVIRFQDMEQKRTNATSTDLSAYQLVEEGDFVLNNQQAWRGSVGVSKYKGIISPAYIILQLSDKFNYIFANYYFRNGLTVSQYLINSKGVGTIQRNLYWGSLKQTYISIPPKDEQIQIVEYIETQTAKIDKAIELQHNYITKLKEYKASLIDSVVTGKVRVA
jgi:type I restriction enzyme S subunit